MKESKINKMSKFTYNTCKVDEKLNDWVMMCTLYFHQYIATWIYVMPYWSFMFAFVQIE